MVVLTLLSVLVNRYTSHRESEGLLEISQSLRPGKLVILIRF